MGLARRFKAASLHFALNAILLGLAAVFVLTFWYPPSIWPLMGLNQKHVGLIVGVLVGPTLMTLASYAPRKPNLKLDLSIIAVIQAGLFGFLAFAMAPLRPVYLVAALDRLELVRAGELSPEDLATTPAEFLPLSWTGPRLVAAVPPSDPSERYEVLMSGLAGKDIHLMPRLYSAYDRAGPELARRAKPLTSHPYRTHPALASPTDPATGEVLILEETKFVPLKGTQGAVTTLIEADSGRILRNVRIDPWMNDSAANLK